MVEDDDLGFLEASRDEEKDEKESKVDAVADVEGHSSVPAKDDADKPRKAKVVETCKQSDEACPDVEDKDNRQENDVDDVEDLL